MLGNEAVEGKGTKRNGIRTPRLLPLPLALGHAARGLAACLAALARAARGVAPPGSREAAAPAPPPPLARHGERARPGCPHRARAARLPACMASSRLTPLVCLLAMNFNFTRRAHVSQPYCVPIITTCDLVDPQRVMLPTGSLITSRAKSLPPQARAESEVHPMKARKTSWEIQDLAGETVIYMILRVIWQKRVVLLSVLARA